jgi:DNA repair/transcription protein MET18/MMS19
MRPQTGQEGPRVRLSHSLWTCHGLTRIALEFLSRTLDFLSKDVLKPSQSKSLSLKVPWYTALMICVVKLLVGFFGAMFDVDHKAGVMPSATALSRIVAMKAFQPTTGDEIIQKVCALKYDFPRQVSKTRLAVFELLRSLITKPEVASDLQYKHGASSGFMNDLLQLCRNERDPSCLMVWFDILAFFLREYSPSQEMIEEVYGTFKAYFPITLPRTSQSGITPEELKLQLRKCFTSNYALAPLAFPFLLGKLDQGDGVTVNVKVDILKTVQACLDEYKNPEQSVTPYVDQIWSSLKYEVRNGEIEDTIWATLEVLKTLAVRLKGDNLRDYCLAVTRDCVSDLANAMYTAPAGRLLVGVLSATPSAFVLMASPAITNIKENLRHPKGPGHSQDLLKLLHVILETRLLLVQGEMSSQDKSDFAAIDPSFKPLYDDVYKKAVELGTKSNASYDDQSVATQAVQGAGALVPQRPVSSVVSSDIGESSSQLLLTGDKCIDICDLLFTIISQSATGDGPAHTKASDDLINETTKALQRAVTAYPPAYPPLVQKVMGIIRKSWAGQFTPAVSVVQTLGPLIAFVGCSELPCSPRKGLDQFLLTIRALYTELVCAIDSKADVKSWCGLSASIQASVRCFNDACTKQGAVLDREVWDASWQSTITTKYPILEKHTLETGASDASNKTEPSSVSEIHGDFLLISLYVARLLYRKATKTVDNHPRTGKAALDLSDDFSAGDNPSESQYLHLLGTLAGFVFHELSEEQQLSLQAQHYALHLFRDDSITLPQVGSTGPEVAAENGSSWDWVALERLNILSFGILEALRPSAVAQLVSVSPIIYRHHSC